MVARDHSHPSAKSTKGSNRTTTEEPPEETEILAVKLKPTAAGNKKATVVDDKYSYWISSSLFCTIGLLIISSFGHPYLSGHISLVTGHGAYGKATGLGAIVVYGLRAAGALGTSVGSTADLALIRMQADATLHAAQHRN